MSLKYTILGFIKKSPKTGYDLQKKIETTISHFWPSTQSQIYRLLNEMAADGLIVSEIQYQDDKPNKKVYTITEKGIEELICWLSEPVEIPGHRNQILVQLFFSKDIKKEWILANLRHYKAEMESRLSFLNSGPAVSMLDMSEDALEKTLYRIIYNNGIEVLGSEINWAEESIRLLENTEEA